MSFGKGRRRNTKITSPMKLIGLITLGYKLIGEGV